MLKDSRAKEAAFAEERFIPTLLQALEVRHGPELVLHNLPSCLDDSWCQADVLNNPLLQKCLSFRQRGGGQLGPRRVVLPGLMRRVLWQSCAQSHACMRHWTGEEPSKPLRTMLPSWSAPMHGCSQVHAHCCSTSAYSPSFYVCSIIRDDVSSQAILNKEDTKTYSSLSEVPGNMVERHSVDDERFSAAALFGLSGSNTGIEALLAAGPEVVQGGIREPSMSIKNSFKLSIAHDTVPRNVRMQDSRCQPVMHAPYYDVS